VHPAARRCSRFWRDSIRPGGLRAHARRREPLHRRRPRSPLRRTPTGRAPHRRTTPTALTIGQAADAGRPPRPVCADPATTQQRSVRSTGLGLIRAQRLWGRPRAARSGRLRGRFGCISTAFTRRGPCPRSASSGLGMRRSSWPSGHYDA
jgi:hypothetical protein